MEPMTMAREILLGRRMRVIAATMWFVGLSSGGADAASITVETTYYDDATHWVLGQVAAEREGSTGLLPTQVVYDADSALPIKRYAFGQLVGEMSYNPDATLATFKDGAGNLTTLQLWSRGIPGKIIYADGSFVTATVDAAGQIRSVVDETSAETRYEYDGGGRLSRIVYPAGDSVAWNDWSAQFRPLVASDWRPPGVADGQWMRLEWYGNYRKVSYFDAMWRPLVVSEYDEADPAGTGRSVSHLYDLAGREIFRSYPTVGSAGGSRGVFTEYDILGRPTSVSTDSEAGPLITLTRYGGAGGYNTVVTSPGGRQVQTWYQTFGAPVLDWPVLVSAPEGQVTEIARDVFGKPMTIRRRNGDGSVSLTRSYVYDAQQRLCKSIEPEPGATAYGYDGAGNVIWQASGLALPNGGACDEVAAYGGGHRADRTYDARNRLKTLVFQDGNGNQSWSYFADGKPSQIITSNDGGATQVINTYSYNKRRLLTSETSGQVGLSSQSIGYGYDANGAVASTVYPSGLSVSFAPNALGQATQAGPYAIGVSYHPNGGIRQFTYGNGIVHTMSQNGRQLPQHVNDSGGVLDNTYGYDSDGNVLSIDDGLDATRNRSMQYDGLDRLVQASSPAFGGSDGVLKYTYDALDNLRSAKQSGVRSDNYIFDANNRLNYLQSDEQGMTLWLKYDAQGNLSERNEQGFKFDDGNRLREAIGRESYRYDGLGRRVASVSAQLGDISSFYSQSGELRWQNDARRGIRTEYVYLNGSLVAELATAVAPAKPQLTIDAFSSSGNYPVSWNSITGATSYELHEQVGGGAWSAVYVGSSLAWAATGKAGGTYGYRVRACRQSLCGEWSAVASAVVQLPPAQAPSISVPANAANGNYTVSWGAVAGATRYRLEESALGGAWGVVSENTATSAGYSGRPAGSYSYRVTAWNLAGYGPVSQVVTTSAYYAPSTAPMISAPGLALNGNYAVSWAAVAGANKYQLEESANGGAWVVVGQPIGTSQMFTGRPTGNYAYRVKAGNDAGWSSTYSNTVSVASLQPPAATTLSAPGTSSGDISLSWGAVATTVTYRLEQSVNGGAWGLVQQNGSTVSTRTGLASGSYAYRVQACNDAGCGSYSNTVTTVVDAPPAVPTGLTAKLVILDASVTSRIRVRYTVTWGAVATATRYEVTGKSSYSGPANSWVFEFTGPSPAASFQVRACTATQCSAWSAAVNATQ